MSLIMKTFVGATGRDLEFTISDVAGDPYDLTGLTVTLRSSLDGTVKINAAAMTIDNASAGQCSYSPSESEIDEVGEYTSQIKITDGADIDFTEIFTLDVQEVV